MTFLYTHTNIHLATYSIRDLAKLSGIKAHTIRIWEQRYAIIEPKRTASNIRYYTDEDLKFLMNIAFLNRKGVRISKIAKMSIEEVISEVDNLSKTDAEESDQFQGLAISMLEFDEYKICQILNNCFRNEGVEKTILKVLVPFLEKTSLLSLAGSVTRVHEQFVSNLIRRKVLSATNEVISTTEPPKMKVLLFLSEAGQQELYLLFVEYLLRKRNVQVIYLGSDVSVDDLKLVNSVHQPQYVYTIVSEQHKRYVSKDYIVKLSEMLGATQLLVTGFQQNTNNFPPGLKVKNLDDLTDLITFFS
jgi:MerR family transcriptional regulator, light-induced transcriptional regulator